jgi:hypothetical protein
VSVIASPVAAGEAGRLSVLALTAETLLATLERAEEVARPETSVGLAVSVLVEAPQTAEAFAEAVGAAVFAASYALVSVIAEPTAAGELGRLSVFALMPLAVVWSVLRLEAVASPEMSVGDAVRVRPPV